MRAIRCAPYVLAVLRIRRQLQHATEPKSKRMKKMKVRLISTTFAVCLLPAVANAQVIIDMGEFTCDQYLAMSPAMSRDFSAWMSGWFSNQTGRRVVDVLVHQKNIAIVKSWCQTHPEASVMSALQSAIGPQ